MPYRYETAKSPLKKRIRRKNREMPSEEELLNQFCSKSLNRAKKRTVNNLPSPSEEKIATEKAIPRPKTQKRRCVDPTTCEKVYSEDELEFMKALDQYKRDNGRPFPTCSEILEVIRSLGYIKVIDPGEQIQSIEEKSAESIEQETKEIPVTEEKKSEVVTVSTSPEGIHLVKDTDPAPKTKRSPHAKRKASGQIKTN